MDILNNAVITYDCIKASVDVTEKELSDFSVEKGDIPKIRKQSQWQSQLQ